MYRPSEPQLSRIHTNVKKLWGGRHFHHFIIKTDVKTKEVKASVTRVVDDKLQYETYSCNTAEEACDAFDVWMNEVAKMEKKGWRLWIRTRRKP